MTVYRGSSISPISSSQTAVTASPGALPDIARPDARLILAAEWTVSSPGHQRAALDMAIADWQRVPWPEGLLSHSWYIGSDGHAVFRYSQWASQDALDGYRRTDPPKHRSDSTDPDLRLTWHGLWQRYRSVVPGGAAGSPGSIVVVRIGTYGPTQARQWIDAVIDTLAPYPAGMLSAHFHINADGTQAFNYAEWTDDDAHRTFIEGREPGGPARTDSPEWRRIMALARVRPEFRRYRLYRSLVAPSGAAGEGVVAA